MTFSTTSLLRCVQNLTSWPAKSPFGIQWSIYTGGITLALGPDCEPKTEASSWLLTSRMFVANV
jgi:hypothetical protein